MENRITNLFGIQYPIIQAGMVWVSGHKLASAVSNAGGLGLIGAGSMYPDVLREHIRKCKKATIKPFGVNIPLFYPDLEEILDIILEEGVRIVFTSAGNPKLHTKRLKDNGVCVAHVVSSVKFARKAQESGVDAIVAEGFEAGGHNGREETTTFTLIPMVRREIDVPLLAAERVGSGQGSLLRARNARSDGAGSRWYTGRKPVCSEYRVIGTREFQGEGFDDARRGHPPYPKRTDTGTIDKKLVLQKGSGALRQKCFERGAQRTFGKGSSQTRHVRR